MRRLWLTSGSRTGDSVARRLQQDGDKVLNFLDIQAFINRVGRGFLTEPRLLYIFIKWGRIETESVRLLSKECTQADPVLFCDEKPQGMLTF